MIIPAYIINIFYEKIRPTVLFGTLLLLGTLEYILTNYKLLDSEDDASIHLNILFVVGSGLLGAWV